MTPPSRRPPPSSTQRCKLDARAHLQARARTMASLRRYRLREGLLAAADWFVFTPVHTLAASKCAEDTIRGPQPHQEHLRSAPNGSLPSGFAAFSFL